MQAEDGIRDVAVTGVQTCALPISGLPPAVELNRRWDGVAVMAALSKHGNTVLNSLRKFSFNQAYLIEKEEREKVQVRGLYTLGFKIGRASCRERVEMSEDADASRRRHTRCSRDWSSDVCSSDLRFAACR